MNIFVIYIGGKHQHSLIEVHDIRFALAEKIEDTYNYLRESWWGTKESLHLDAWGILKGADGYKISLKAEAAHQDQKLYFVNLGGYDSKQFTELHENRFVVASDEKEAKLKAVSHIQNQESPHRDYLYEVENLYCLNQLAKDQGLYIYLEPTEEVEAFEFICKYVPISAH